MNSNDVWATVFGILLVLNITAFLTGEFYWLIFFFTILLFGSLVRLMWKTSGMFVSGLDSLFGNKVEIEFQIKNLNDE